MVRGSHQILEDWAFGMRSNQERFHQASKGAVGSNGTSLGENLHLFENNLTVPIWLPRIGYATC